MMIFFFFQNSITVSDMNSSSATGCQPLSDSNNSVALPPSPTAVISSSPTSLETPRVCQQGPPAFVPLSSLKSHLASSHREKLLAESPRGDSDVGNHGDSTHEVNTRTKSARMHVMTVLYVVQPLLQSAAWMDTGGSTLAINAVCDACGKAFFWPSGLREHKMIHTGHRPFVCDVCSKAFTCARKLKKHKMTHTGHRPFACDMCSKAFTDLASALKKHEINLLFVMCARRRLIMLVTCKPTR